MRLDAGRRLMHIEPLDSSVEYGWMAEFAETVTRTQLRHRLQTALARRRPFRRFKGALLDHPGERERWFAFRDGRVRAAIGQWLAEQEIVPTTPPPEHAR